MGQAVYRGVSREAAEWLARCAAVFEAADPPRAGRIAFWMPPHATPGGADGSEFPGGADGDRFPGGAGEAGELIVAVPGVGGDGVRTVTVPAVRLPVAEAVPVLSRARRGGGGHRAAAFWGAATVVALQLVARGRMLPGVTGGGFDAWRTGPLDTTDMVRIRELAAAMPPEARAVPLPGPAVDSPGGPADSPDGSRGGPAGRPAHSPVSPAGGPTGSPGDGTPSVRRERGLVLAGAEGLVRGFLDAVADGMPRTAAAPRAVGTPVFAAVAPQRVPRLRGWADEVAAGLDSGVRISVRLERDCDPDEGAGYGAAAYGRFAGVVQVHSLADPTLIVDAGALWAGPDGRFGERARLDTVLAVRRASRVWPALDRLLHTAVPDRLGLGDDEIGDLLGGVHERLAAAGVDVHWPKELVHDLTARVALGAAEAPPSDMPAFFGGGFPGAGGVVSFNWQLALGGQALTEDEMDRLAEAHRPVVRLRDQWVLVDPELARRARERELKPLTAVDALGAALTGAAEVDGSVVEVAASGWLDRLRERIADPDADSGATGTPGAQALVPQPEGLAADLRDYQLRGLRWLDRMTSLGLGGCLADDMGLGKTITLIALHLHRNAGARDGRNARDRDPGNGGVRGERGGGVRGEGNGGVAQERNAGVAQEQAGQGLGRSGGGHGADSAGPTLVVCPASLLGNWEREIERFAPGTPVRRYHGAARSLDGVERDAFVLTTYGTMRLDAARLAAGGWGLLVADEAQHVKNPRSGTARALRTIPAAARIALTGTPVENNLSELWAVLDWTTPGLLGTLGAFRTRWAKPVEADHDPVAARRLSALVGPFLLRRRKSDPGIAPELPSKTETDRPVALTREQAGLYEAVTRELMEQVTGSAGMARRGHIVKLLTGLKQICNHPAQYLKEARPRLEGRSGKLELLGELVDTITSEDGAVLVFTQYVAMARLLERHLGARGVGTQLLHGGTPVRKREEMVQRFQDGEAPVFLLSLKAAGTGLNLTRADHVIHYDRWWNPAVEDQATDRAYRIGQTRPVQVHRLIAEGTVEDRIAGMLAAKRDLADAVLGSGEAALTELTDAELADLVALRGTRER